MRFAIFYQVPRFLPAQTSGAEEILQYSAKEAALMKIEFDRSYQKK
jgi:hypothetical protein